MIRDVVIVGASLAGLRAAETFRTEGHDGRLTVVGAEPHLPYDRPPLSKKVLAGEWDPDRIVLRKPGAVDELGLELRLGTPATGLDVDARRVHLADGDAVPYDALVIATGATPRRLPGQPVLPGVHELRTLDDALALRADLDAAPHHVVVIGAGFIGAEVAATARVRGLDVSIVEALPVPLVRGLGPVLGEACAEIHRDHGVHLHLGVGVDAITGTDRVEHVRLANGAVLPADVVVVGIGVRPATDWLEGSGLVLADGVCADETLAAGPPGVYVAGDVARWPNPRYGEQMRVEHWTNAAEQGALAARNALLSSAGGLATAYDPVPFFWSDQYDARIQFLGRASGDDDVRIVLGELTERRFVALYGRHGRLRGVFGLSMPKALMSFRRLLVEGASWDDALAHAATLA
jgi:NADPH-dependent 2,4-dienoyl-CoA reductase/sulfur reductase-like enzyme